MADAAATAAQAERLGYHSAWSPEFYNRSAVVSLAAMSQATATTRIGSSIAYAVGRSHQLTLDLLYACAPGPRS